MGRLEEKLKELGYERIDYAYDYTSYIKIYDDKWNLIIGIKTMLSLIEIYYIDLDGKSIYNQQDIEDLQVAFNALRNDVKEIEQCQD